MSHDTNTEKEKMTAGYTQLDYAKFIAAVLVVAIHIPPLEDINSEASLLFQQVICRLAVPFFFVCSGFFLGNKLADREKTVQYVKRIGKMYAWWSFLYIPMILVRFWESDRSILENGLELARRFFLVGSYIQLWYLLATIYGVLILYLLIHVGKLKTRGLAVVAVLFYVAGIFGNSYRHLWDGNEIISSLIQNYRDIFVTTRNGIFFAFPFLTAGYLIFEYVSTHKRMDKAVDKYRRQRKMCGVVSLLFIAGLFGEYLALTKWGNIASFDLYFMTPFAVISLFLFLLQIQMDKKYQQRGKQLRQLSTNIFLIHMMVNFYLKRIPVFQDSIFMQNSVFHYLTVLLLSILLLHNQLYKTMSNRL